MQRQIAGVKKLLSEIIPQFVALGDCNDHHISNALKHPDIQEALVHMYQDIGGAKAKGLKKERI